MTQPALLAIDEGTTNAKVICVDSSGQILGQASSPVGLSHPKAGWAEQDPEELLRSVKTAIAEVLSHLHGYDIVGICISNQRESVLVWDRQTGIPLSPVVSWQCRRSDRLCRQLLDQGHADQIQRLTGLPIDPLFPSAKIKLLLDSIPNARLRAERGEICVGTIDSWLVWQLSGKRVFVTDYSNASRTQLFNIHQLCWDPELLDIFDIPAGCLPEVMESAGVRAETRHFSPLADGIPVLSQIGDSHAALYGQGGFLPGTIKATYGTGSSLMTPVQELSGADSRLGQTIAWHDGSLTYALEGNITHTGAGVAWMAKMLGKTDIAELSSMAQSVANNDGVYFVPALSGLGAPYWDSQARGVICGMTDNTSPAILARAAFEAIAYQIADVFYSMEQVSGQILDTLLVDGGPTKNRWLMQFQADLLQKRILCSAIAEVSALGAAHLGGKALGWWKSHKDLAALVREVEVIEPKPGTEQMAACYEQWKTAVARTQYRPGATD